MAATYRASAAGGGTSGSGNRTVTITPAVGDLLVVVVSLSGNTNDAPTMTDNNGSGTYTRAVGGVAWSSSANRMAVFVRDALMVNTTSTTITCASGSNTAGELVAIAVSGMTRTGSAAIRSSGSQANQAASTTPAPALNQAALTGNMTIAGVASGDTTTTPATGWTERQDVSQATPTTACEVCTRDSGFTGTTITFGATQSTVYASFAVELDGSAPAITGDAAITEFAETAASAGAVDVFGAATIAESAESIGSAGATDVGGAAAIADLAESAVGTGVVDAFGAAAIFEVSESLSSAGVVEASGILGDAAIAEIAELVNATGAVDTQGTASLAEVVESTAAAGATLVVGSSAIVEVQESAASAGSTLVAGASTISDPLESIVAAGSVEIRGAATLTEQTEASSSGGAVAVAGVSSAVELIEQLAAAGSTGAEVTGDAAIGDPSEQLAATASAVVSGGAAIQDPLETLTASNLATDLGLIVAVVLISGDGPYIFLASAEVAVVVTEGATMHQGDLLPIVRARAFDAGAFLNLPALFTSIAFRMVSGSTVITGPATGDANGNLTYTWQAGDTAVPGTYEACFIGTTAGGQVQTLPSSTHLTIVILPLM